MHGLVAEIGIAILVSAVIGYLFHLLKQPLIMAYIVAGAIIGPEMGFRLITEPENIEIISEIGLILLLFVIGLELNIAKLRSSGREFLYAGVGQFALCVALGLGLFLILGYGMRPGHLEALYLALACALSSTAIVVKILYDKFELDTHAGRITLGILIFQDIWAILVLALQPNFADPRLGIVGLALAKSAFLLAVGFLSGKYLLHWMFERIAKTPELVVALSLAWCAGMAGLSAAIGVSMEMGALIAGVAISSFPYGVHVTAKVLPLRDFFLTLFFLAIGMKIPVPDAALLLAALLVVGVVFATRFATVYPILSLTGRGRRTCFLASLNLAQISEFSLVITALGVGYGHISDRTLSLVTYAMAATSVLSSYLIKGNQALYLLFDGLLAKLRLGAGGREDFAEAGEEPRPVVMLGCHRAGMAMIHLLREKSPELLDKILAVDFSLEVLRELKGMGVRGVFGDIGSMDTLEHARVGEAEVILCTVPDTLLKGAKNEGVVRACQSLSPGSFIVATAESVHQAERLREMGADEVILIYDLVGDKLAELVGRVR